MSDRLTEAILGIIRDRNLAPGDAIPSARELAKRFEITTPTIREALRKLEATGAVEFRHGSGTYVGPTINNVVLANPHRPPITKESVLQLIGARLLIEPAVAAQAAGVQLAASTAAGGTTEVRASGEASGVGASREAGGVRGSGEAGGVRGSGEAGWVRGSGEAGGVGASGEAGGVGTSGEASGVGTSREAGGVRGSGEAGSLSLERLEASVTNALTPPGGQPFALNFHVELAAASGNPVVEELLASLLKVRTREQQQIRQLYDNRKRDYEEHRAIFEAVRAGDAAAAERLTWEHLDHIRQAIEAATFPELP